MEVKTLDMPVEDALWPDSVTGIVLAATEAADNFFRREKVSPSPQPLIMLVRRNKEGDLVKTLISPAGESTPEAWNAMFFQMTADPTVVGALQAFVGCVALTPESIEPDPADRTTSLVQLVFARGRGLYQIRVTPFIYQDGRAHRYMGTVVTDLEETFGARNDYEGGDEG